MTDHDRPAGDGDSSPGGPAGDLVDSGGRARLGFPGGRLRPADWTALAQLATEHSGHLQLSSGGVVQIPGAPDGDRLRDRAEAAGLVPRLVHETGRTILSSPLAGRLPGRTGLGDLPEELDAALDAHPDASSPAAPVVFGFDDGSGDVLAHGPDLAAVAGPVDGTARIHAGGRDTGLRTSIADVVSVLVDAAAGSARSAARSAAATSPDVLHDLVVVTLTDHPLTTPAEPPAPGAPTGRGEVTPVGWVDTLDGLVTLLAVVADGVVPARLAEFLGAVERPSTISADRVIGLHELTEGMAEQVVRVLAPMGMVFDATSPWAPRPPGT